MTLDWAGQQHVWAWQRAGSDQRERCRSAELIQQRIQQIGQARTAADDPAIVRTGVLRVRRLVRAIAVLRDSIAKLEEELRGLASSHPDFPVFDSRRRRGTRRLRDPARTLCRRRKIHFRWACSKFAADLS